MTFKANKTPNKMSKMTSHLGKKLLALFNTRLGLVCTLLLVYWLKTLFAYYTQFELDFTAGQQGVYQFFISVFNPLPLGLLLLGLPLYFKNSKVFYTLEFAIYLFLNVTLIANVIYFREFTDFMSLNTVMASKSSAAGLGDSFANLIEPIYIVFVLDFVVLIALALTKKFTSDKRDFGKRPSFAITALSCLLFSANLFAAEIDRPQLLSRGFSNTYIVRALGFPAFYTYNAYQLYQNNRVRSAASAEDLESIETYVKGHYAKPNPNYYGIGKGRNVIVIHLESFQQFLLDYQLQVNGQSYEVTPFLNSLYHSNSTLAFSNFFNQVKAGKTSDAETMMETSLFGLNQGSFFVQYGSTNTQQAAPAIFGNLGYTSAVFHGNVGSFWNRNGTYKQLGYNYFFDSTYMTKMNDENSFQYGLNDKIMFKDSIKYLEHMQQPFYTKFITVSNHYPYTSLPNDEKGFPQAQTNDETINGYFATANYLDTAVKNFFDYLKAAGLYDNSVIVLYGDHYGISNSRNSSLAPLVGKNSETWSDYDNAMMQRVPYMIVVPGFTGGKISDTYGGEIDALPTLEHIMGIDSSKFIQLGQDLLSPDNQQIVAMRTNGYYVTPQYTSYGGKLYNTQTGEQITNPDNTTQEAVSKIRAAAKEQLSISDKIQTGDLLRFYKDSGINAVDPSKISYVKSYQALTKIEKEKGDQSTSVYSKHGNQSTVDLYQAPTYTTINGTASSSTATP